MKITIIGAGNVGSALARGFARSGHAVTLGVRNPGASQAPDGVARRAVAEATRGADVVVLAIPVGALADTIPRLDLAPGQIIVDATNAVRTPIPDGAATIGAFVASRVPAGVAVVKAFNTIGAEHLDGTRAASEEGPPLFLPIAGDDEGRSVVRRLAAELGFDVADLGRADAIELVESHARLWIHLALAAGWGRSFGFATARS